MRVRGDRLFASSTEDHTGRDFLVHGPTIHPTNEEFQPRREPLVRDWTDRGPNNRAVPRGSCETKPQTTNEVILANHNDHNDNDDDDALYHHYHHSQADQTRVVVVGYPGNRLVLAIVSMQVNPVIESTRPMYTSFAAVVAR